MSHSESDIVLAQGRKPVDHGFKMPKKYQELIVKLDNLQNEGEFLRVVKAIKPRPTPAVVCRMEFLEDCILYCRPDAKYQVWRWLEKYRASLEDWWIEDSEF